MLRLLGFPTLDLSVVLVVHTALQVDYPSNHKEQDAHTQQHGGLLVDVRQLLLRDHNWSMSTCHPLEQKEDRDSFTERNM